MKLKILIFILFLILILILIYYYYYNVERFSLDRYCSSCQNINITKCKNCINCGICYYQQNDNIISECVNGNINGPYFNKKCLKWTYS